MTNTNTKSLLDDEENYTDWEKFQDKWGGVIEVQDGLAMLIRSLEWLDENHQTELFIADYSAGIRKHTSDAYVGGEHSHFRLVRDYLSKLEKALNA